MDQHKPSQAEGDRTDRQGSEQDRGIASGGRRPSGDAPERGRSTPSQAEGDRTAEGTAEGTAEQGRGGEA